MLALACAAMFSNGCASLPWGQAPDTRFDEAQARHRAMMQAQQRAAATEPVPTEGRSFEDTLRAGDRYRRKGDRERALWSYLQALRLEPKELAARERIAFLQLEVDPVRAESQFTQLLAEDRKSASAQLGLGLALLAQERLEAAAEALEAAVRLDDDSPEAHSALGAVRDRLGRHAEAQESLRRAHQLSPRDPRILNNLGVSHLIAGELAAAEVHFRRAVALDPRDPAAQNNLGLALGLMERYDEALAAFRRAGTEQAALNNLGYVYFLNGRPGDAVARYEQALMAEGSEQLVVLRNLRAARDTLSESR